MKIFKITCYADDVFLIVAKDFGEAETKFKNSNYGYKEIGVIEEIKIKLICD